MNKLYKNKKWLKNKYINEKLSDTKIGKLCGVSPVTILNWRDKFNIVSRNRGESVHLAKGNYCNLSPEAIEWINGEVLGDGRLSKQSKYAAQFCRVSSKEGYIKYISNTLKSFGIEPVGGRIYTQYTADPKGNYHYGYYYFSHHYIELLLLRNLWYPQGKKIVPRSLKLTPLTVRQWYIGDGCLSHPKDASSSINLNSQGFPVPDVEWLGGELIKLGFKVARQPSSNTIRISVCSVKDFLTYIGPCPAKDYQYKWNYYKKEVKNYEESGNNSIHQI